MDTTELKRAIAFCELEAYRERIMSSVKPCVYLCLGDPCRDDRRGSRIGGRPNLPAQLPWPADEGERATTFALQVDLRHVPRIEGVSLPPSGLLLAFVDPLVRGDRGYRIVVAGDAGDAEARALPPSLTEGDKDELVSMKPHQLHVVPGIDVPRWASDEHSELTREMSDDEQNCFNEDLPEAIEPNGVGPVVGRLFGYAAGIGHDPRLQAYRFADMGPEETFTTGMYEQPERFRHWRHVLTIDSNRKLQLTFGDAGYFQFLGRDRDLAAGDFSQAYALLESS